MTDRSNFPSRVEKRRSGAVHRNEEWASLSHEQKLTALDQRLGVGQGAAKQRARIAAQMEKPVRQKKSKA